MAERPVFLPSETGAYVKATMMEFEWFPGLSPQQKIRSVKSLHSSAEKMGISPILEISSKSTLPIGVALSAFNLSLTAPDGLKSCVECFFQGSKVFELGGPFTEMYNKTAREAKKDPRLKESGRLTGFRFMDDEWPLIPKTVFYDYLYLTALNQNTGLAMELLNFSGFTDIEFNPERQLNCQARSAALYVSFKKRDLFETAIESKASFQKVVGGL